MIGNRFDNLMRSLVILEIKRRKNIVCHWTISLRNDFSRPMKCEGIIVQ